MNAPLQHDQLRAAPPHNIEAEQGLLGAILVNNDAYGAVASIIEPEHLFEPIHRVIFEKMGQMISSRQLVTPATLKAAIPEVTIAGMPASTYILRLAQEATTVINAPDYAAHIREQWELRQISEIGELAREQGAIPREALTEAWSALDDLRARTTNNPADRNTIGNFAKRVLEDIDAASTGEARAIPSTGFSDVDRFVSGGWRNQRLYVLAGRPGMGKTIFGVSSARRVARQGYGVGFFSLEIDGREVASRMLADELARSTNYSPIAYADILSGSLQNATDRKRIEHAQASLDKLPIEVDASGGLSMFEIAARARIMCERWRKRGIVPGAIVIDYLGLIRPSDRYRGRKVDELGEIALACKQDIAKRLDVACVLLAQLNRGVESRDDKRPNISDLRDSGSIEEHADMVGLLYRPAYYDMRDPKVREGDPDALVRAENRKHNLELVLGKNRLGPAVTVTLWCDAGSSSVDNMRRY